MSRSPSFLCAPAVAAHWASTMGEEREGRNGRQVCPKILPPQGKEEEEKEGSIMVPSLEGKDEEEKKSTVVARTQSGLGFINRALEFAAARLVRRRVCFCREVEKDFEQLLLAHFFV